jgi:hypothetical protein
MTIAALMLSGLSSYARAKVACQTWGRDFDILEVHSFTACDDLPIVRVGRREGPRSCFDKRLDGLVAQSEQRADWYLCCSDDNYVWRTNLEAALRQFDSSRWQIIGGHSGKLKIADGTTVIYPSGGAGYVMSWAALDLILCAMRHHDLVGQWNASSNNDDVEDVFIGWAADQLSIPFVELAGFYGCNPMDAKCHTLEQAMQQPPLSFHYVSGDQMRLLHSARNIHPPTARATAAGV